MQGWSQADPLESGPGVERLLFLAFNHWGKFETSDKLFSFSVTTRTTTVGEHFTRSDDVTLGSFFNQIIQYQQTNTRMLILLYPNYKIFSCIHVRRYAPAPQGGTGVTVDSLV